MRSGAVSDDRSARVRIRDAALARFATEGIARASVRSIATDAGVSPALVLHHFGSKDGLRRACDAHVVALVRSKVSASEAGAAPTVTDVREAVEDSGAVVGYLARALLDGSADAAALYDEMVALTRRYLDAGERAGWARPSQDPHSRAVLLVTFELGVLVLGAHVSRALGVDVGTPDGAARWARSALELYTNGLLTDGRWQEAVDDPTAASSGGNDDDR